MQTLLFFSRVTFICNICFVMAWLMRYIPSLQQGQAASTILVLGLVVAVVINILVNLFLAFALLRNRQLWPDFPHWLIITNFLFLIPQIILFTA